MGFTHSISLECSGLVLPAERMLRINTGIGNCQVSLCRQTSQHKTPPPFLGVNKSSNRCLFPVLLSRSMFCFTSNATASSVFFISPNNQQLSLLYSVIGTESLPEVVSVFDTSFFIFPSCIYRLSEKKLQINISGCGGELEAGSSPSRRQR